MLCLSTYLYLFCHTPAVVDARHFSALGTPPQRTSTVQGCFPTLQQADLILPNTSHSDLLHSSTPLTILRSLTLSFISAQFDRHLTANERSS